MRLGITVLIAAMATGLAAKDKPPTETGTVTAVQYVNVPFAVGENHATQYTIKAEGYEFDAAQMARTAYSRHPEAIVAVGDQVQFRFSGGTWVEVNGKRMMLRRSTKRPK